MMVHGKKNCEKKYTINRDIYSVKMRSVTHLVGKTCSK
jgi:hypothetical protein